MTSFGLLSLTLGPCKLEIWMLTLQLKNKNTQQGTLEIYFVFHLTIKRSSTGNNGWHVPFVNVNSAMTMNQIVSAEGEARPEIPLQNNETWTRYLHTCFLTLTLLFQKSVVAVDWATSHPLHTPRRDKTYMSKATTTLLYANKEQLTICVLLIYANVSAFHRQSQIDSWNSGQYARTYTHSPQN